MAAESSHIGTLISLGLRLDYHKKAQDDLFEELDAAVQAASKAGVSRADIAKSLNMSPNDVYAKFHQFLERKETHAERCALQADARRFLMEKYPEEYAQLMEAGKAKKGRAYNYAQREIVLAHKEEYLNLLTWFRALDRDNAPVP